jgi:hypothetical protein
VTKTLQDVLDHGDDEEFESQLNAVSIHFHQMGRRDGRHANQELPPVATAKIPGFSQVLLSAALPDTSSLIAAGRAHHSCCSSSR